MIVCTYNYCLDVCVCAYVSRVCMSCVCLCVFMCIYISCMCGYVCVCMCVMCVCHVCMCVVTVPNVPPSISISLSSVYTYGNAGFTVSWIAPSDNGGSSITGYTTTCTGGSPSSYTGTSTSFAVTGLSGGVSVTCTVKATNIKGDSTQQTSSPVTPGKSS